MISPPPLNAIHAMSLESLQSPFHAHISVLHLCVIQQPIVNRQIRPFQVCFMPPRTAPRTSFQLILSSNGSSTNPTTATLSPRIKYSPCGTSTDGSSSSGGLIIRSCVSDNTKFVIWSQLSRVPTRVRESHVKITTFLLT